ncbi:hypothetical protein ACFZA1_41805 [Streptomyces filipinensis]|uniref:hypothetical protein n=1 Tax=Streptomyces filipinensis TaxID=66887 RepID=UPI0036E8E6E7
MGSPQKSKAKSMTQANASNLAFWPFSAQAALFLAPLLLVVLTVAWGAARTALGLDTASAGWVLVGIVGLSLLPVLLVVLSGVASTGGSVELGAVKIALTAVAGSQRGLEVPRNVVPQLGVSLADAGGVEAIVSLRKLRGTEVVIVDLEDGHAWWETRLMLLSAGATRLGRPSVVVFTAQQQGRADQFIGWARPADLLECLQESDPGLRRAYLQAFGQAVAVRLAEPTPQTSPLPTTSALMKDLGLQGMRYMTHPAPRNELNPLLEEQLLARSMADFEALPAEIDVSRLHQLFTPVLHTKALERTDDDAPWLRAALLDEGEYVAFTDSGRYTGIMSGAAVARAALLALLPPDAGA